jgi:hypothetical protein
MFEPFSADRQAILLDRCGKFIASPQPPAADQLKTVLVFRRVHCALLSIRYDDALAAAPVSARQLAALGSMPNGERIPAHLQAFQMDCASGKMCRRAF